MDDLKPCPFCGGIKFKIDSKKSSNFRYVNGKREDFHVVTVRCNKCHTRGPTVSIWLPFGQYDIVEIMRGKAAESWNRRPDHGTN